MISCPSIATLALLGTDSFGDEAATPLEQHIEACARCQGELDRLVQNDAGAARDAPRLPDRDTAPRIPGFVIECELGRGGMGVVYQALQPSLDRRVALKVVRSGPGAGSRDHARWLREARAFSCVRHPNVVPLFEVDEADGWLYLVLELIPGGTMERRLNTPYAPRDAALALAEIAEAVVAIHREGLVHLDLKPSNILLDGPPDAPREWAVPRVADFGIAWRWSDPDATLATASLAGPVGTPSYMAPEQIRGDRSSIGPAADIYGLGALLYHLLTGHRPFAAAQVIETLDQVRDREPVPPRRLNPAVPRDLETICLKCLRKEPSGRYESARAVADDLGRFLDGVPIAAHPTSPLERTWRRCRRRPAVATLAAALAVTLVAGFLGMFLLWRHAESERMQAEFHRTRAEADFRLMAELLNQSVEMSIGGQAHLPKIVGPEHTIASLRRIRRQLLDLAVRLPDRETMYVQLEGVDIRLGNTLSEQGRLDELGDLLKESLRMAEGAVRLDPRIPSAWRWRTDLYWRLAELAEQRGKPQDGEPHLRRSIAAIEEWAAIEPSSDSLTRMVWRRGSLARVLALQGRRDEARVLLLDNHRSLDEAPLEFLREDIVAQRVLNRLAFLHLGVGGPPPPRIDVAGPPEPLTMLGTPEADRLPAPAWASLVARALRIGEAARPPTIRESLVAFTFTRKLQEIAGDQRKWGRLDQARQTADRLVALASMVVDRSPDDPTAHLMLADAYEQVAKNAWRIPDRATIEQNSRLAIRENRQALELAPYDEMARHTMDRRERKLDAFLHPAKARDPESSPRPRS